MYSMAVGFPGERGIREGKGGKGREREGKGGKGREREGKGGKGREERGTYLVCHDLNRLDHHE